LPDAQASSATVVRTPASAQRETELAALIVQDAAERGSAAMPVTWLFEPESAVPLARLQQEQLAYMLCDLHGSPCALINADGRSLWSARLSSYGELRELRGARSLCPFRRPGHYEDLETGLQYQAHSYYDPETGVLIGPAPIGIMGTNAQRYRLEPLVWIRDSTPP
jgi:RHS repeat-associated protein